MCVCVCVPNSSLEGEIGSEKGYFVSNSIEWVGHAGQPCIYCRRNQRSVIGGNSPDIFLHCILLFSPQLASFLKTR